jgi:hypothetical protein
MAATGAKKQLADRAADHSYEGLHQSRGFHRAEGDVDRDHHVQRVSLYGIARRHPMTTLIAAAGATVVLGLLAESNRDS